MTAAHWKELEIALGVIAGVMGIYDIKEEKKARAIYKFFFVVILIAAGVAGYNHDEVTTDDANLRDRKHDSAEASDRARAVSAEEETKKELRVGGEKLSKAQDKTDSALYVANNALKGQIIEHRRDVYRIAKIHKSDSLNTLAQINAIKDSLHKSIKLPTEPYLDILPNTDEGKHNPTGDFRNDTAFFNITVQNFKDVPAKNLLFECVFLNPITKDLYLGEIPSINENATLKISEFLALSFRAYVPDKLPNSFYVYIKLSYTNMDGKLQKPFERVFLRNKIHDGEQCVDVSEHDFQLIRDIVYNKYPAL